MAIFEILDMQMISGGAASGTHIPDYVSDFYVLTI